MYTAAQALLNYLRAMPDPEFVLSQYVDYRSADGLFRKYRVALIGGEAYAVHMGNAEHIEDICAKITNWKDGTPSVVFGGRLGT